MSEQFDPYYVWLGIPPKDQPPNHYRLLGIEVFEDNEQVIDVAANRQTTYLHEMASGPNAKHSQQLLNEIAGARNCLLDPVRKSRYDEELRQQFAPEPEPEVEFDAAAQPETESASEPEPTAAEPEPEQAGSNVIPVTCGSCGAFYEVGLEDAGTLAECVCGNVMTVPLADGTVPSTTEPQTETSPVSSDDAAAVAVAPPPVAVADEPAAEAPASPAPRKRKSVQTKTGRKTEEEKEEDAPTARKKKKSGWAMPAILGVATVAVAFALFKVLTADPSDNDEPKPDQPRSQTAPKESPSNNSDPDEPDDTDDDDGTGGGGTFGPIRLDG